MLYRLLLTVAFTLSLAAVSFGQNSNSAPTRPRQSQPAPPPPAQGNANTQGGDEGAQTSRTRRGAKDSAGATDPTSKGVLAAFNALLDGIRKADVDAVTSVYWNSPQLVLFNYNGTVTRGWEQLRKNRESSYPNIKDVKLDVRDVRVQMLGREGALVTCLWTQSQTYKGTPETASGRMSLVFRRIGGTWKIIHLHTSPDAPDPSRVPASEQPTPATTRPSQ